MTTYLRLCLRYQLIAKATYLVRHGGLRYQLVAEATYLRFATVRKASAQ